MIKLELVKTAFGGELVVVEVNNGKFVERNTFKCKNFRVEVKEDGTFNIDPLEE